MKTWMILLVVGIFSSFDLMILIFLLRRKRGLEAMFQAMKNPAEKIIEKCMVCEGIMKCPGIAQILGDYLIIKTILNDDIRIHLDSIKLVKEKKGFSNYAWIGKTIFVLKTPNYENLAIGVKNPDAWRKFFAK